MNEESLYLVVPKATIRPNKIVFYNSITRRIPIEKFSSKHASSEAKNEVSHWGDGKGQVTESNKHSFEISAKAGQRIREKVTWLYELARNKTVQTTAGTTLFSFKMNFITLTLPAKQFHTTAEITEKCLNQFLTECKSKFNLQNYVWRLEFQKNGNVHYHLATDTYISYTDCKLIWNRCLQKLGYISAYQDIFIGMKFSEYCQRYSNGGKTDFNTLRERFGRGTATRWDSPNSVDVRAVSNAKNIAFYISKYITKKQDCNLSEVVREREDMNTNLRLWFCSRSLSRLDKIEVFLEEYDHLIDSCINGLSNIKSFIFDYCKVWYFNGKDQVNETKRHLWLLYRRYSNSTGYIPA